ncbi:MAG: uracil-DNA glycosylase [Candidatus Thioglobus sp.]|uniref:uracil-DNA glycosylase n=1 Tax=Candidatus Thioglobus sp. TaxID=2026721 RepID=UPI001EB8C0E4|nr:uracil-DNA glycosylase [Candidatus Thioglobus sp.]MBT3186501.1 uracil-DNA glycosylase [Candidatus Thioglobus sp.]MBT4553077.1 uracil-DNA glycosylase [Candidatus Thioglobus sp.]MBT5287290.1 uracil-DNA glycosylase [Candidatus Thioglobus sp.]
MVGWALTKDWSEQLDFIFKQDHYRHLLEFLEYESAHNKTIYPPKDQMFNAFDLSSFKNTKVIILGQDPYHNEGQAHGLSFSVPDGIRVPPSLRNIYQELSSDLSITPSQSGNLTHWATQGVLLLNSALTVEKNSPGSHAKSGWVDFTDTVIDILNEKKQNLVFLLWGAYAQKKTELIDQDKHLVLMTAHPSPFSAHKGFFGCKHFSKTNDYLKIHKLKTINW